MARPWSIERVGLELGAADLAAAPGVVHEDVDRAPPLDGGIDHRLVVALAADVGAHEERLGAGRRRQLVGGGATAILVDLRDHETSALFGEAAGDALADALAAAGDHRDPLLEPSHVVPFDRSAK